MFIIYMFFFHPSRQAPSFKAEHMRMGGLETSVALHMGKAGSQGLKEEIEAAALRENCGGMTEVWP